MPVKNRKACGKEKTGRPGCKKLQKDKKSGNIQGESPCHGAAGKV